MLLAKASLKLVYTALLKLCVYWLDAYMLQEARTGIISLSEDDPQAVQMMIHYFYHLDYPHVFPDSEDLSEESPKLSPLVAGSLIPVSDANIGSNLIIHARVFALAEKYYIDGLMALALTYFETEVIFHWDTDNFLQAAVVVYTSTPDTVRGMRDVVVETFDSHRSLLFSSEVREIVKVTEGLAYDILIHTLDQLL